MRAFLRALSFRMLALALILTLLAVPQALAATKYATLEFGSRGSDVLKLQKALLELGFNPNGTDGKFGRGTGNGGQGLPGRQGTGGGRKGGHVDADKALRGNGWAERYGDHAGDTHPTPSSTAISGSRVTRDANCAGQTWVQYERRGRPFRCGHASAR